MPPDFTFELWQDGFAVASATASDVEQARREIMHYARQYVQDGPVEIKGPIPSEVPV